MWECNVFLKLQVYKIIKKNCKGAIGMPLGIQIVGRRYQEELILALMMQLDQVSEFQNARKWRTYWKKTKKNE